MKIKTSEATKRQLNWLVAKCEGASADTLESYVDGMREAGDGDFTDDWSLAGPIMEREKIYAREEREGLYFGYKWNGVVHRQMSEGPKPLIAAMRCHVVSRLGNEVEVPDELLDDVDVSSAAPINRPRG